MLRFTLLVGIEVSVRINS